MWRTLIKFLGAMTVVPLMVVHLRLTPRQRMHAKMIRFLIQSLGVVPIKISQLYSNLYFYQYSDSHRPLLLEELYTLQDSCRTHSDAFTKETLHSSPALSAMIQQWDPSPLASGSIAQIHRAKLYDENAKEEQEVVIKVRHPGVKRDFEEWMRVVRLYMTLIDMIPTWIDPPSVGDVFSVMVALENQLDLRVEGVNLRQYHAWYCSSSATGSLRVRIPKVYAAEEDLLVLEYIPKMSSTQFYNLSEKKQMELLTSLKLWMYDQVLVRNCIHGDLHDGNWGIVLSGEEVVVYDFGMVYRDLSMGHLLMTLLQMDTEAFHTEITRVLSTKRLPLQDIERIFEHYRREKKIDMHLIQSLMDIFQRNRIPVQSSLYLFFNLLIFVVSLQRSEWMRYGPDQIVKMDLVYARRIEGMEGTIPYLRKLL
jgi:predicted unusual protein kinase regulating ubiquinone biosynthesis (AarF/ABC1/UbiB family)